MMEYNLYRSVVALRTLFNFTSKVNLHAFEVEIHTRQKLYQNGTLFQRHCILPRVI